MSSPVCRMMLAVCVSANCRFIWGWCLYQTCHVTFTLQAHWVTFHIRRLSLYITMTKTGIFKTNHDLFVSFPDPNRVVVMVIMTVWWLGNFINLLKKTSCFGLKFLLPSQQNVWKVSRRFVKGFQLFITPTKIETPSWTVVSRLELCDMYCWNADMTNRRRINVKYLWFVGMHNSRYYYYSGGSADQWRLIVWVLFEPDAVWKVKHNFRSLQLHSGCAGGRNLTETKNSRPLKVKHKLSAKPR